MISRGIRSSSLHVLVLALVLAAPAFAFGVSAGPSRIVQTGMRNGPARIVYLQVRDAEGGWTADSSQPWCTLTQVETDVIEVSLTATTTSAYRDATITIQADGDTALVPVRQWVVNAQDVTRWAGTDRYGTSAYISRHTFRDADTIVIATGENYADALAAAPLAGCYDGPVLLTARDGLPGAISAEVQRLRAKHAIVVGSDRSVSAAVVSDLEDLGVSVTRPFAGADRYATAAMIAEWVWAHEAAYHDGAHYFDYAFLARGDGFADALAASPMAYHKRIPILLTKPSVLPTVTKEALDSMPLQVLHVVGGTPSVSSAVASETGKFVFRHDGVDRYETAAKLTQCAVGAGCAGFGYVSIATGQQFPDALSGAAATGANGGILLLTKKDWLPKYTWDLLVEKQDEVTAVRICGGLPSIDAGVEADIMGLMH